MRFFEVNLFILKFCLELFLGLGRFDWKRGFMRENREGWFWFREGG